MAQVNVPYDYYRRIETEFMTIFSCLNDSTGVLVSITTINEGVVAINFALWCRIYLTRLRKEVLL